MADFVSPAQFAVEAPQAQPSTAIPTAQPPQLDNSAANAGMVRAQMFKDIGEESDRYGEHLDTLQAQDAVNKLRAAKEDLTYGQQNGFMNVKGLDVINKDRPGGPLISDFSAKLQAQSDNIAQNLSPRARQMYNQLYPGEMTGFKADIAKHSIQQTEIAHKSIYTDGANQDINDAVRFSTDPDKLTQIMGRAGQRARSYAAQEGLAPDAFAAEATSNVARAAIETQMSQNNGPGAIALYRAFGGVLSGKDQIDVGRAIKTVEIGQTALGYVSSLTGAPTAGVQGATPTAVHKAIVGQESGGQQFDAKGKVLTSVDGAKGIGQMTQGTFNQFALPGEKIENKDDNLAASRRAIDFYYKKYNGDPGRIATAYFSGEGNVSDPGNPLPYKTDAKDGNGKSTSSYVADVGRRLGMPAPGTPAVVPASAPSTATATGSSDATLATSGSPADGSTAAPATAPAPKAEGPPGFLDVRRMTMGAEQWHIAATQQNRLDHADNPALLTTSQGLIDKQFEMQKAQIEFAKNKINYAMQDYVQRGGPNGTPATERPPPELWNQFDFRTQHYIDEQLTRNAGGKDRVTDMPTYYKLSTMAASQPLEFGKVDLLPYFDRLSNKHRDELMTLQRGAIAADPTAGDLRTKQTIIQDAAQGVGLKWGGTRTPEEATATNNFINWVEESGRSWTQQNGRKPSGEEWQKIADGVTMKVPGTGTFNDSRLDQMTVGDVPGKLKQDALTTFAKRGAPEPSNHDLIAMYATAKIGAVPPTMIPTLGSELKKRGRAVTPQTLLGAWRTIRDQRTVEAP